MASVVSAAVDVAAEAAVAEEDVVVALAYDEDVAAANRVRRSHRPRSVCLVLPVVRSQVRGLEESRKCVEPFQDRSRRTPASVRPSLASRRPLRDLARMSRSGASQ